jgi:translation initiation factor 2 alpha subunit (eIF-2alpha)
METAMDFFNRQKADILIAICNHIEQRLLAEAPYQDLKKKFSQTYDRIEAALPAEQKHLLDELHVTETEIDDLFKEALFLRGMQNGANLAAFLRFPEDLDYPHIERA